MHCNGSNKKAQKHQNKTGFKIIYDTKALQVHKKVSLNRLCERCKDQINWKLKYNKYKRMTQPARCQQCEQKVVCRSYMKLCDLCSHKLQACVKCLKQIKQKEQKSNNSVETMINNELKLLRQRSRRTIKRGLAKGTIKWDIKINKFINQSGQQITNLHWRNKNQNESQQSHEQYSEQQPFEGQKFQEQLELDEDNEDQKIQC